MPHRAALGNGVHRCVGAADQSSTAATTPKFWSCSADQQDTLVGAIEQDENPACDSFRSLLSARPHGGNRDFLGWEFIGRRMATRVLPGAQEGVCVQS
jgi:hypothetical protein